MTTVDLLRIFEEQAAQERNEAAEAQRLSRARLNLRARLDEIELHDEEER